MRWTAVDAEKFFRSKEYVDTVLIPVMPVSFQENCIDHAGESEYLHLVSAGLEKQFQGRVLLMPPLIYCVSRDNCIIHVLLHWTEVLETEFFQHICFLTVEKIPQQLITDKRVKVLPVPAIPMHQLDRHNQKIMINEQIDQLSRLLKKFWMAGEKDGPVMSMNRTVDSYITNET